MKSLSVCSVIASIALFATSAAWAEGYQVSGKILKPDGNPLEASAVSFTLDVLSPEGSGCIIYQEQVDNVNMTDTKGSFHLTLGTGTKVFSSSDKNLEDLFSNSASLSCKSGGTFSPLTGDERLLRISFYDGSEWQSFAPQALKAVPYATEARNAQSAAKVGAFEAENLLRVEGGSAAALTATEGANLLALAQGTSNIYMRRSTFSAACTSDQTLSYNSAADTWGCVSINFPVSSVAGKTGAVTLDYGDISNASGKYLSYKPNNTACAAQQVLKWDSSISAWKCGDDSTNSGTVTSVTSANSYLTITNTSSTPTITAVVGTSTGTLAAGNDSRFSDSRIPAGSAGGDLSATYPNPTVSGLLGKLIDTAGGLVDGTTLVYNSASSQWKLKAPGCDSGWSQVSSMGVPFCIKQINTTASDFNTAISACLNNQARLCTFDESVAACYTNVITSDAAMWSNQVVTLDLYSYMLVLSCEASTNNVGFGEVDIAGTTTFINSVSKPITPYCCRPLNR